MASTVQNPSSSREVQTSLTDRERSQVQRLFSDPTELPQIFKNWITSWTEQDVALALTQIQGWSDFLNSQTATDASQASSISSNASGISTVTAGLATTNTNVAANTSSISSLSSTVSGHTSSIAAINTLDTTQNGRLSVLEAHPIPRVLDSDFSAATVSGTTAETQVTSLTLLANTLTAPGICEFHASGTWVDSVSESAIPPSPKVYVATTLVAGAFPLPLVATGATTWAWELDLRFTNTTSTSAQEVTCVYRTSALSSITGTTSFVSRTAQTIATSSNRAFALKFVNDKTTYSTTCNTATLTLLAGS